MSNFLFFVSLRSGQADVSPFSEIFCYSKYDTSEQAFQYVHELILSDRFSLFDLLQAPCKQFSAVFMSLLCYYGLLMPLSDDRKKKKASRNANFAFFIQKMKLMRDSLNPELTSTRQSETRRRRQKVPPALIWLMYLSSCANCRKFSFLL